MTSNLPPPTLIGRPGVAAVGLLAVAIGALESVVTPTLPLPLPPPLPLPLPLPLPQRELALSPSEGALLSITLLVTGALVTPIAGRLGDRYGGKRVLVRLMAVVPVGGMAGTLSAGPGAENLSRHWMFALPTLAVLGATVLVNRLMPHDPPGGAETAGFDQPGLPLLSGTLITLMIVLSSAPDLLAAQPLLLVALLVLPAALATGWVAVERRAAAPMIDLHLLARPVVWRVCALTFVLCVGTSMAVHLVPQLFSVSGDGDGFGAGATAIGFLLLPGAAATTPARPAAGIGVRRFGTRAVVTTGIVLMVSALPALFVVRTPRTSAP